MAGMVVFGLSIAQAENPCKKDRETFCSGKKGKEMMECMVANKDKVSADCKAHHEKMKTEMKEVRQACKADLEKYCADVKPGRGGKMKCAMANKEKFSAECQAEMAKAKEEMGR